MTLWTHAVSWSKAKLALDCPRALQHTIDKKPHPITGTNYYRNLGTAVQFVFEQYFNQKVNLRPGGTEDEIILKVTDKIIKSKWYQALDTDLHPNRTQQEFDDTVRKMTLNGLKAFRDLGVLTKPLRSEHKWISTFAGHRIFVQIDFTYTHSNRGILFDGKGHGRKDADPRQITYCALAMAASGIHLDQPSGLIYWQHDPAFESVDVSPKALKQFVDGEFQEIKATFNLLKKGTHDPLPAKPESKKCNWCPWKDTCDASPYFRKEVQGSLEDTTVSLG